MTATHKLFKSTIPFTSFFFKDGTQAPFVDFKYWTDDVNKVNELMEEVQEIGVNKSKHPMFYVDELEQEVDPEAMTPYALMEKAIRAKILAEQQAANDVSNDRGNTDQTANFKSSIGNTVNAGVNAAQQSTLNLAKTIKVGAVAGNAADKPPAETLAASGDTNISTEAPKTAE